jgi:hypothetical protein
MDADPVQLGGATLIRITRGTKGDAMASIERLEWFEPDGHEFTGYAAPVLSGRRPAGEVLSEHRKSLAVVAMDDDDLWEASWGELVR